MLVVYYSFHLFVLFIIFVIIYFVVLLFAYLCFPHSGRVGGHQEPHLCLPTEEEGERETDHLGAGQYHLTSGKG